MINKSIALFGRVCFLSLKLKKERKLKITLPAIGGYQATWTPDL
jgi:hypothetical protein